MEREFLYYCDQWWIFVIGIIALLTCMEIGFQWGRRCSDTDKDTAAGVATAMMGFLALLLGFSFSMAVHRFDVRRDMLNDGACAIQSAYKRLSTMPQPEQDELRRMFLKYIKSRIKYYSDDPETMQEGLVEGLLLQDRMWERVSAVAVANPNQLNSDMLTALIGTTNALTKRNTARNNHVPEAIIWILFAVTVVTVTVNGYVSGLGRERRPGLRVLLVFCPMLVLTLIIDIDRPRRGLIVNNQNILFRIQNFIEQTQPPKK